VAEGDRSRTREGRKEGEEIKIARKQEGAAIE
jgi:hypothetical protein